MQNPIPSPRRSDDFCPIPMLPRRTPLVGPVCPVCDHPSCRVRRAQRLPRLGGHRSEFAREHAQATAIQIRYRHLIIWWGEATQSFWIATPAGLEEARDIDALLLALWPHSTQPIPHTPRTPHTPHAPHTQHTDPPAIRPWARTMGSGSRVPAMT